MFLQDSAYTGAAMLAGLIVVAPTMALGALLGLASGTVTARLLRIDAEEIRHGLHGYNGALLGLALTLYLEPGWPAFVLILVGGGLTVPVMRAFGRGAPFGLPALTAPFVMLCWLSLATAEVLDIARAASPAASAPIDGFVSVLMRGVGQVMFQDRAFAGACFVAGIALHSRGAAAWALIGSAGGSLAAIATRLPAEAIDGGLYGFNAALVGIALSRLPGALAPLAGIALSVALMRGFQVLGLPALTAPFVLSTWMIGAVASRMTSRADH